MSKKLLLLTIALLLAGTLFGVQTFRNRSHKNSGENQPATTNPASDEGAFRETQQEQQQNQQDTSTNQTTAPSNKKSVAVSISQAEYDKDNSIVHVKAFADTLEDGTCTLTFTQSGQPTRTYKEATEMQPSYVSCNPFDIPRSDFPKGDTWVAKVVFESANYRGEASKEITL